MCRSLPKSREYGNYNQSGPRRGDWADDFRLSILWFCSYKLTNFCKSSGYLERTTSQTQGISHFITGNSSTGRMGGWYKQRRTKIVPFYFQLKVKVECIKLAEQFLLIFKKSINSYLICLCSCFPGSSIIKISFFGQYWDFEMLSQTQNT